VDYAVVGVRYGTLIYDVTTNPAAPVLVYEVAGPSGGDYYYHRDYKTYEDHLYIVNEMWGIDEGVQIIDLSPLPESSPIKLNTYTGVDQSHNLWVDEELGLAFIESDYPNNIHILDLNNPSSPIQLSEFSYNDGINCHDIYTVDNMAYVSEGWSYQFGIYDISDIYDPVRLATIPASGYAHNSWVNSAGTHLITTEETVGMTVKIWDIQDLSNINLVGEYLGENNLAHNVHVKDDFVYISHYTTGIKIIDIFNPEDPIEVAAYDTYPLYDFDGYYGCWGAFPFTENGYVYASDMQYGLFVLDHGNIEAGWVNGSIIENNLHVPNVEIRSTLNGKSFYSDAEGNYSFGFPSGAQEFELFLNNDLIDTCIINILPHQSVNENIILGIDQGDVNGDGVLNILDIVTLVNLIILNEFSITGDLNSDGLLNILDVVLLVNIILS
ncbi:MAG: choice-of-anchor B family protein, partial [Pelagibacterales bacterium]|nr:choice-of-anchor B family protein [Pelagibacterales bacterium]